MNQKRFLTADEVFQLFGVDASALNELVDSGAVKALKDLGNYRYRAEDFAALVKLGKLTPRTAGELFQVDDKGEMPFLKLKQDDQSSKLDDGVSFIELDEEALSEQAQLDRPKQTPVIPEKWFDDSDDSVELTNTSKTPDGVADVESVDGEKTDFDLDIGPAVKSKSDSDSNVRFIDKDDESIDLDEPDFVSSGSDSDVRLEGPVSSPISPFASPRKKSGSDSDVKLAKSARSEEDSDSDVVIPPSIEKPDSDSDVTLAMPATQESGASGGVAMPAGVIGLGDSDSDVILVAPAAGSGISGKSKSGKKPDSDSDVRIAKTPSDISITDTSQRQSSSSEAASEELGNAFLESIYEPESHDSDVLSDFDQTVITSHDSGIRLESGDSGITLEHIDRNMLNEVPSGDSEIRLEGSSDSGITLDDSGIRLDTSKTESEIPVTDDSGMSLVPEEHDSGIAFESAESDSGITLVDTKTDKDMATLQGDEDSGLAIVSDTHDSGIALDSADSGLTLESARTDSDMAVAHDSGISLEDATHDSGLTLESTTPDSGLTLESAKPDSGIALDSLQGDSGIRLDFNSSDSGLSLERESSVTKLKPESADSGIRLSDAADSGIRLGGAADSGIRLSDRADSGIRLSERADSGISFGADDEDPATTQVDIPASKFGKGKGSDLTQTLDLSRELPEADEAESGDSIGDHTVEMSFDDSDAEISDTKATIVNKGRSKPSSLSGAFKTDESLEVEDLDISEDLDSAVESEYSGEFAEAEEEVLEAADDDFSGDEISAAEGSEDSLSEASAPAVKVRAAPREPAWGLVAIIPIGMASLAMLATVMILWGGVATMWTGGEAPGPAAMLISALAGLF